MCSFIRNHRETIAVGAIGFAVFAALNIMMLQYHYEPWTNPKAGFWSVFWNKFEVSGFDPYTYIVISKWRPLYILSRHPLLAVMMWPLSQLNEWLKDVTGMNCAIHIVAVMWTLLSTCSWMLMYRIMRKIVELDKWASLLLTVFFFSFSHVFLLTFVSDHMAFSLPLLLLTIYLAGKNIKENKVMPLWQSLLLLGIGTGVTTTNCVKIALADSLTLLPFTRKDGWGARGARQGKPLVLALLKRWAMYLIPLGIVLGLYFYQDSTSQAEERRNIKHTVEKRMERDKTFAKYWKDNERVVEERKKQQTVHISIATNTEYHIDRLPSLIENIFGEGLVLHDTYVLKDSNKHHRPVEVHYRYWWQYAIEFQMVALFLMGVWLGRREKLMWMAGLMFLFDMALHVGLNFASADVYIMTAHWAFVIPIAYAFILKHYKEQPKVDVFVRCIVLFFTIYMLANNVPLIVHHILG